MNRILRLTATLAALGLAAPAWAQAGPYAGEHNRDIKALDARDVAALRQGQGMGLAKAAELNGYPGPMHTLELAAPLQLSDEQRTATRRLMDEHKARARALGEAVVAAEAALDRLFAARRATPARVSEATQHIATLQAQLRAEHLNTHLAQAALLSPAQTQRYAELRGYGGGATGPGPVGHQGHQGHPGHQGHHGGHGGRGGPGGHRP